jgi:hypothetical protein
VKDRCGATELRSARPETTIAMERNDVEALAAIIVLAAGSENGTSDAERIASPGSGRLLPAVRRLP